MYFQRGPRCFSSALSFCPALVDVANPPDVALDIGKQPTMAPMGLFASRCKFLDLVNVGGHRGRLVHLSTSNDEAYDVENVADITIDIDEAP